jgi:16S rRNA U516 pseudouridylate synthase RsuA-like enzyme
MEETLRLNKAIAQSGICSRRKADELIAQGRVRVNGAPAEAGMRVTLRDSVTVANLSGTLRSMSILC